MSDINQQEHLLPGSTINDPDAECTTPEMLEKFLHGNLELNESRMLLRENCRLFGLNFGTNTAANENCFFEAVFTQLNSTILQDAPNGRNTQARTPQELRQFVVKHTSEKYKNSKNLAPMQDSETWCTNMEQEGTFADTFAVFETAEYLKRDIVIVTGDSRSSDQDNVSWIVGQSDFNGEPLRLGHYCKKYYQSLEPIDKTNNNGHKPTKQRVIDMKKTAKKAFTCICSEDIRLDDDTSIHQLKKGDHISRPFNLESCGLSRAYTYFCFHHAILAADVSGTDQNGEAEFEFIGFAPSNESKAEPKRYRERLNYKKMDIYKIVYKQPKYKGEQVIRNVLGVKKKDIPYNLLLNNCEHLSRKCVTGEAKSKQVENLCTLCTHSVFGCLPTLLTLVLSIVALVDDTYATYNQLILGMQSCAIFVYFCLLLRQSVSSWHTYKLKQMCKKCLQNSWLYFVFGIVFTLLSVAEIVADERYHNGKAALWLGILAVFVWFITNLCKVCSKRCRRNTTRFCLCSFFIPCCCNPCYNAIYGGCSMCIAHSKCCQGAPSGQVV